MRKIFLFCMMALVAMCGLNSCSDDCNHDFIEKDYSAALVGIWTCLEEGYAEALIFNTDGSVISTGYDAEKKFYWEDVKGTVKVVNNKMTMIFEDDDNFDGSFDFIPGQTLSLVDEKTGERTTYSYCAKDLSEEIVGMWVCNDTPNAQKNDMSIISYFDDGVSTFTGMIPNAENYMVTANSTYHVVGDLLFQKSAEVNSTLYIAIRLDYIPDGTSLGDIMTQKMYANVEDARVETTMTYLRINQYLDLPGKVYDYSGVYVSNVKGLNKEIEFMDYTMNFATMDGSRLDKMLKAILFQIDFPDARTIRYSYQYNGGKETFDAPVVVEGNKLTVKMSGKVPALKDVEFYAFQDADGSQMHFYMHTTAFVNFYTNMQALLLASTDAQFDITDAEAVNAIYNNINEAVESINLSIVMKESDALNVENIDGRNEEEKWNN